MDVLQVGQLRKNLKDVYDKNVDYHIDSIQNHMGAITFMDKAIFTEGGKSLATNNSYYLNFTINRLETSEQIISIYLKFSSGEEQDNERQLLKTITIDKGHAAEAVPFEFIITPIADFDEIVFELQRTSEDYEKMKRDRTRGREITLIIQHFSELQNIVTKIGHSPLRNIGVQGPTGMLMSINGEEIRIGRTGIYELTYNIPIDFIGFVVPKNSPDYFILDYQYK